MSIFRVVKTNNFTVMSNHHLKNRNLSYKAKGLISTMLSLPENWNYTLKGLSQISKDSVDSVRTGVKELEQEGYIIRHQVRSSGGVFAGTEYIVYEVPETQGKPPLLENPITENPTSENPMQLNTNKLNTKDIYNNPSINRLDTSLTPSSSAGKERKDHLPRQKDNEAAIETCRELVKDNIEYAALCASYSPEQATEILELIVETICGKRKHFRIGGEDLPSSVVKSRFMKLNHCHIQYVFDCLAKNTTKVRNIKSYLLTSLYNSTLTIGHYYSAEVNHDFGGIK